MALTGFRLDNLAVRWLPIIGASVPAAGAIILLFSAIPRINTGFIPSFATASQQIGLTDELAPGGLSDLLESDEIAFRAVPDEANQPAPAYWRVFVLSVLADDSGSVFKIYKLTMILNLLRREMRCAFRL